MRKIIGLIRNYYINDFEWSYFIPIALFTALLIWANYHFNFETTYITFERNQPKRLLLYFLMYFFAFGGAYSLYIFSKRDRHIIKSHKLWLMIILGAFLFAFRWWFDAYSGLVYHYVPVYYQTIVFKYIINLSGFIWLFIPCCIYWFFVDRKEQPIYGFHAKGVVLKPYFILVLLMIPLIAAAATQHDFLSMYPRLYHTDLPRVGFVNNLLNGLYEVCYGIDFVNTEFFFRGFLILAFARFVGPKAILPMCVFYVTIHFEKPLGETISSFFGGWLLGIIAYETKSIYGGVIVHLGIAMLMEVIALAAMHLK